MPMLPVVYTIIIDTQEAESRPTVLRAFMKPLVALRASTVRFLSNEGEDCMLLPVTEFYYEIESDADTDAFTLMCVALLLDLLGFKNNVVIRNQYARHDDSNHIINRYAQSKNNVYVKRSSSEYRLWIRDEFSSNFDLLDLFELQGMQLSYLVPSDKFASSCMDSHWPAETRDLLMTDSFSFACDVMDEDQNLSIAFNSKEYGPHQIRSVLSEWERRMVQYWQPTAFHRKELMRQHILLSFVSPVELP